MCAGYVHGKNPRVCPEGCVPDANLGKDETPLQTLIREALEYQVTKRPLRMEHVSMCLCSLSHDVTPLYGGPAVPRALAIERLPLSLDSLEQAVRTIHVKHRTCHIHIACLRTVT